MDLLKKSFSVTVPEDFGFLPTVMGSGWTDLAPYVLDREVGTLSRVLRVAGGGVIYVTVEKGEGDTIDVRTESGVQLDGEGLLGVESGIKTCLMLDIDLSGFYSMLESDREFAWVLEIGAGRSIRGSNVFEDVVKTISMTNASWGLTKGITRRLCEKLGDEVGGHHSFPTPHQLAERTEEFLRREVKSGFRSPYLLELARNIVEGRLNVESWKTSDLDSASLRREIMKVKGVGPISADNILKLLGRYDFLALDNWYRKRFYEIHGEGKEVPDEEIEGYYSPFGKWKGLVMGLDLTKDHILSLMN